MADCATLLVILYQHLLAISSHRFGVVFKPIFQHLQIRHRMLINLFQRDLDGFPAPTSRRPFIFVFVVRFQGNLSDVHGRYSGST